MKIRNLLPLMGFYLCGFSLLAQPFGPSLHTTHLPPGSHAGIPVWSGGLFLLWNHNTGIVEAFDPTGRKLQEIPIVPPDVVRVRLYRVAAKDSCNLAAIGTADKADGTVVSFLALWRLGDDSATYIPIPGFGPQGLTYAADGTIWIQGRGVTENFHEPAVYDLLRHYTDQGVFLESTLPRTNFQPGESDTVTYGHLVSSPNRLGFLLARKGIWVEFDHTGRILGHWKFGPKLFDATVISVAMANNGDTYVQYQANQSKPRKTQVMARTRAGSGKWEILSPDLGSELDQRIYLYGADGDQLVVGSARDKNRMEWATPLP